MEESKQIEEINVQESLKDNLNNERVEEQSKIDSTVDSSIVPGVQESTKTDNSSNVPGIKESTKVESIDDSSKSTEVKESPKLSSAEKLAILRQRRANKILNSGGERLSKIVNSYSNDSSGIQTQNPISTSNTTTLATEGNQGPDAIVKPEPQSQSTSIDTDVKPELFSPQTLSDVKQEPQAEVPDILLNQSSTSKASAKSDINTDIPALTGISSLEEKELELPFLDEELEFKEPSPSDSSTTTVFDILGWVHGVSFTCLAVYTFTIWIHSHAHEMFASNSLGELDRWYHQICRQLEWMSSYSLIY
ncbi:hypothetical protein BC833DRAFT_154053 [Globomyces pollinis-pini]|nr:hypothetical protein BC833DRAFT_154053 [Globomyces pollinis-pini]